MQARSQHPYLRTDHATNSWDPLKPDSLDETQLMPASSAAAGFPFGTQDLSQSTGLIYGTTTDDNTPVLLNRYNWSSHSMARMGMVGSGKSYAAKLEIIRMQLAYTQVQTFVVDPKQEYSRLIQALGGQVFTLKPGETRLEDLPIHTHHIVGFEVEDRGQRENVEILADTVEHLYQAVSQDQDRTHVVVDEARILMNDEDGKQLLNQFVLEGRDTNTAVTLISQNASHFTYCREGREILDNMPGKVFMRHDRVPDSVVDYFDLSTRERQQLYELRTGTDTDHSEAIIKVSGRLDTQVRINSTPAEHGLLAHGKQ
jgi:type IV secretory pathway VirB4 component